MRLNEIATAVRVTDEATGKSYHYWVSQVTPERAIQAALKKHRDRNGLGAKVGTRFLADHPLKGEIITDTKPLTV